LPFTETWPWLTIWRAAKGVRHEFGAVHNRIETALEKPDHLLAGVAGLARGFLVIAAELPLGDIAVIALQLLLGVKLRAIVGKLARLPLTVLTGAIGAPANGLLLRPQIFSPMRRSSLYFEVVRFRHAVFFARGQGASGTESPPKPGTIAMGLPLSNADCPSPG